MYLNQNYLLLQRKGQMMLSQLAGVTPAVAVTELDLLLLSGFWQSHDTEQVITDFLPHRWVRQQLPNVTRQQVQARIAQLQQASILQGSAEIVSTPVLNLLQDQTAADIALPEELSVSIHCAIAIGDQGFYIWSAQHNSFYSLQLETALLVLAFADGATVQQVLTDKQCYLGDVAQPEKLIRQLFQAGLLVGKKRVSAAADEDIAQFQTRTEEAAEQYTPWQQLNADGRIPVYFVPHMENHFPLALGVLFSALKHYNQGELLERFQLIPINFLEPAALLQGPYRKFGPGVWLFSNYMWSVELNLQISDAIKQHNSKNITIHGGPSTPDYQQACEDFMTAHRSVDIAAHGEGEVTITEIFSSIRQTEPGSFGFDAFQMSAVAGITFRDSLAGKLIRTAPRARMKEPDAVPSPYLSGYFDGYEGRVEAAIIETNRGCPYGCTFCDWGSATNQKIRVFDLDRVKQEIDWIGRNKIRVMWIADANYGLYDRDIEISRVIVETKKKYGYPQEVVVNYTKNSTWRLVEIIKIFTEGGIISQGIISIQTTDEKTLEVINRKNIRTERYDELAQIFADLKLPLSTDLMLGLPGITIDAFNQDLQRYIDMDVSVKAYPTQLLPNSPMADPEYIAKYQIKVDENNYLISSFSYTEADLHWMKAMYQTYTMADGYSLLRYVLRYLQWQHGIKAVDFLQTLLKHVTERPADYPMLTWAVRFFNQDKSMPGGWYGFYQQVGDYILQQYNIPTDSALQTVLMVSRYSMPDDGLTYPLTLTLQHDFSRYFHHAKHSAVPLSEYAPAQLVISDPNSMVTIDMNYLQYDSHQYFWELQSSVARPKSVSEFVTAD